MQSWSPIPTANLPTVLAGPILRKVAQFEVSVWIVVKEPEDLTLNVYDLAGNVQLTSGPVTPIELGANIYMVCLRADNIVGSNLGDGILYAYNIINSSGDHFNTTGFMHSFSPNTLTYANSPEIPGQGSDPSQSGKLPTFVLPAYNLNDLRVLHGSCRKPHGEGFDELSSVANRIEEHVQSPINRPQMLFLTGDQIYADDVAYSLLHMIKEYIPQLFDWPEWGISQNESNSNYGFNFREHPDALELEGFKAHKRYKYIIDEIGFPAEKMDCKSHLMGFQEFILMYVMVWSPALWGEPPMPNLPTFNDVMPNVQEVIWDYNAKSGNLVSDFFPLPLHPPGGYRKSDEYNRHKTENEHLLRFRETLGLVRKALANIPTYMIFDDHEISDDWFINQAWTAKALYGGSVQKRIVQNGLCAYALCQGWGNTPEQFSGTQPGAVLTQKIEHITKNRNNQNFVTIHDWDVALADIVLPYIDWNAGVNQLKHQVDGLKYHWVYHGVNFEVICTDARTMRAFSGNTMADGVSHLISQTGIDEQIVNVGGTKKDLTILITGTPLYGSGTVEKSIEGAKHIMGKTTPYVDFESWNIREFTRQTVVSALATRHKPVAEGEPIKHRVIVLSGDVHYGFTNQVRLEATETFKYGLENVELFIVQCCASSFKNQKSPAGFTEKFLKLTTITRHRHESTGLNHIHDTYVQKGYNNPNNNRVIKIKENLIEKDYPIKSNPHIFDTSDFVKRTVGTALSVVTYSPKIIEYVTVPDWELTNVAVKAADLVQHNNLIFAGMGFDEYVSQSSSHKDNYLNGGNAGRYIVGYNQFGEIILRWPYQESGENLVDHRIWWRNRAKSISTPINEFPLSVFVAKLD